MSLPRHQEKIKALSEYVSMAARETRRVRLPFEKREGSALKKIAKELELIAEKLNLIGEGFQKNRQDVETKT